MNYEQQLNYITANYDKIIKQSLHYTKSVQTSEDCLSRVTLKMLESATNVEVRNTEAFVKTAMKNQFLNHLTVNKKYKFLPAYADTPVESCNSFKLLNPNKLAQAVSKLLTKKEYQCMLNYLDTGVITGVKGNKTTNKTHFRNSIGKLREWAAC